MDRIFEFMDNYMIWEIIFVNCIDKILTNEKLSFTK